MGVTNFDDPVKFKAGHVIFAEGESSPYLYIVVKGEVKIFKEDAQRLIPISVVREKDFIGELSIFSDEPRSATAIAGVDTELMIIKKAEVRKVIKDCPEWISDVMITISDRLRNTIDVLREHRISDDLVEDGSMTSPEEMSKYVRAIKEYRSRRKGLA
jgi:CRP-like cAMP-binding protein